MTVATVLLHVDDAYQQRFAPWLAANTHLRELGFSVVMRGEGTATTGDVNVVQATRIRKPTSKARRLLGHNLILYERSDSEAVSPDPNLRALIADSRVHACLKDVLPRDPRLHNAATVEHRYHLTLLPDASGRIPAGAPPQVLLDDASLPKVRSFMPVYMFNHMDMFVDQPSPPLAMRNTDVAFAGTVTYGLEQVTLHRQAAVEAIKKLRRQTRPIEGRLSRNDYRELLAETKIFVSPYGYGGFSWKDFEAIYMGAIVIKPDCSFAMSYGFDAYGPGCHVVSCRPDFNDLDQVVAGILDDLSRHQERAEQSRAAIHAARDINDLATDLAGLFRSALDGVPLPPNRSLGLSRRKVGDPAASGSS